MKRKKMMDVEEIMRRRGDYFFFLLLFFFQKKCILGWSDFTFYLSKKIDILISYMIGLDFILGNWELYIYNDRKVEFTI